MKDKKARLWCSKHQVVHQNTDNTYWSCSFPNDKKLNNELRENRKNCRSFDLKCL